MHKIESMRDTAFPTFPLQYQYTMYEVYWDPSKGKAIADSVITTSPIAFIFTRYCLISMFFHVSVHVNENLLGKIHIVDALMSKSRILL